MTGFTVLAGIGIGIAALAVLIAALALLVRAIATLLPPAGQFLGEVQGLREWSAQRAEQERRRVTTASPAAPETRTDGVAPAPVFEPEAPRHRVLRPPLPEGPTSANLPPVIVGDVDRFDEAAAEEFVARPVAPASRQAAKPPGPPIQGEEGF